MKIQKLAVAWAFLYGITAALGFVEWSHKLFDLGKILLSLAFFVPGGLLVYQGVSRQDYRLLKIIRNICLASLISTVVVLMLNFFAVTASREVGLVLYWLLILVSAPMICSKVWILPLFGWACLLMVCLDKGEKRKKKEK